MSVERWKRVRLEDVATVIDSLHKTPTYSQQGYPMVRVTDIKGGFLSLDNALKVSKNVYDEFSKKHMPGEGDIVFSRVGTYGVSSYVNSDESFCLGQNTVFIIPRIEKKFFYYSMTAPGTKAQIEKLVTGSTQKTISLKSIKEIEFELPPVSTQTRIAAILSALDDKIELNRQTNATLEAIAQAIFKEWFVDFRYPGATGEMQDVGTGGMNWAGLEPAPTHLIPKGWRVGRLGGICELAYGKGLKSDMRVKGECPVVGSNGVVGTHNEYLVQGPGIVIGRKGTIGQVTWLHDNFFPIDTTFYIKDQLAVKGLYFHYFLLKGQDFKKIGSDSAVPGLNRNQAHDNLVIIPSKGVIEAFNAIAFSIFNKLYNTTNQSTILAKTRDNLLPKLMNGDISVGAGSQPALSCSQPAQSASGLQTKKRAGLEPAPTQFVGMASPQGSS